MHTFAFHVPSLEKSDNISKRKLSNYSNSVFVCPQANALLTILQKPEDKKRLETLQKEIQSKIPTPEVNREPDHSWLRDTCVRSGTLRVSEYVMFCPNSRF